MNEMNMSFDADKDKLVPGVGGYSHDNFFSLENESSFPHNQSDDNLSDRLNENETGHNILYSSENGNSVESNQRKGNFNKGEISNLNDIVLIPLFTNKNTSITFKETKSTDIVSQKTKTKPLFHTNIEISKKPEVIEDIKDETPKYFPENSINVIIRQFNISKELKSNFLFDNKMKNSELEKIKEVLKSNTIRRRKQSKDNDYRTDNILSQLINIFNLFLLQFINNLINVLYSKEEINQILSGLNLLYKISTHDLNQSIKKKNNKYKNNLMSNPERNLKNPKTIPSIYQNKYNQNINNLSQRYYIYNSNQEINNNENTNKFSYYDLNNDIITTEGTNTNTNNKINDYLIDYDLYNNIHLSKNSSISINIEDLMIFEEKFSEIIFFLKNGKEAKNQCFDFWNYFFNCSLFEKIEKIFKTEKNIEIAKFSINLELISVMITYEFSFDFDILNKSNILLLEILELSHRNLMIICENILMKIIPENQKNIWVLKLNNLVQNSKKYFPKNYSNLSHIDLINKNSLELSNKLQNIFSLFETESSPLINSLFKKIHQKSYTEINDFFIEYILKIENQESSIIAPLLLSSNPNFNSFRPPYIHTERIKQYTLILDLNDTIANFQQTNNSQGILRLRPFLIEFLEQINAYYELILFTTSTEYFSKPIINAIEENKKYFDFIFYREYAIIVGNDFVKDLTRIGRPLDKIIIVDNMPQNFRLQKENGIVIKAFWGDDVYDNALISLKDILLKIAYEFNDLRLGLIKYKDEIINKVSSTCARREHDGCNY